MNYTLEYLKNLFNVNGYCLTYLINQTENLCEISLEIKDDKNNKIIYLNEVSISLNRVEEIICKKCYNILEKDDIIKLNNDFISKLSI